MQKTVLIIEDSKTISAFIKKGLEANGYSCSQAFTLNESIEMISKQEFDFITLDLHLPDGEGDELLDIVQGKTSSRIIVLTVISDKDRRDSLFRHGILDYYNKDGFGPETVNQIAESMSQVSKNKNKTILIVDDSIVVTKTLKKLLEARGYTALVASTAQSCLDTLAGNNIDLAILDLELPDMSGTLLLSQIKKEPKFKLTPILMLSATNDAGLIGDTLKNGAADFLRKPYIAEELLRKVDFWIDYRRKSDEAAHKDNLLNEYKKAVDNSTIVSKTDKRGIITFTNDKFCEISGYTKDELIGKPHSIVRHPDMPKDVFRDLWETILAKRPWHGIVKNKRKDGSSYIVQSTITPILDENGEIVEFIGVRHDVTELENIKNELQSKLGGTERDLRETLEITSQYEMAIDKANATVKTDPSGIILFANEKFCEISGYELGELVGKTHSLIRHKDTSDHVIKELWETIKSGKIWGGVIKNKTKSGKPFWIDCIILPIFIDGELIEYIQVANDITETMSIHEELEDTQRELIYRMGEIGETRSKETGYHVKRVAEYSKLLARLYGLSDKESELIFIASPMHDIGKVGIPDNILLKPGKLDNDEFEIMKTHASLGGSVLAGSKREILQAAAIIAEQHHEKYDGTGYPKGLKADEIHIFARIVAIADVFDALGTTRPYKKGWDLEKILEFFHAESGRHFDPELTELFLNNFDEFVKIKEQYADH